MNDADKMTGAHKCPECGAALPTGALAGLCPACLLKQATADSGTQPETPPFEPPSLADVARLFPSLEILELLGKGGMGAVYKARQPALDRFVALKILPQQVGAGPDFTGRFTREARALARLNHPNIIGVYEFGQVDGLHYFIMEYVDGASLRQLERSGRLSPRDGLQIVLQICEALQYAHDEGVVHRDIKPENILVDRKGRVKIADFGLAKILGREPAGLRLTGEGQIMGTPHYMAPEQVEHPLEVDHRADIYALGVVFYEMLTGELPLGKFASPSRKVQIDVRLDEVVLRSLEKEPELRYQQASQVRSDLQTITGTEHVPEKTGAAITSETDIGKRRVSLRRWLAAGWGILLAGVVLGIIYGMQRNAEEPPIEPRSFPELPIAQLPTGVVQLVAVSYHPSTGKEWWSPDGAPTTEGPFENPDSPTSPVNGTAREFVFRVHGLPADASALVWAFDSASSMAYGLHAKYNGRIANDLFLVTAVFPNGTHTTAIKAGIAMGAWQPGCETPVAGPWATQWGDRWTALFAPPQETSKGTVLTVSHTIKDRNVRIVAVNLAGREITSSRILYSITMSQNTQITATFTNLPLSQIRSFRLQIRPYNWVEFRNVSLEPGKMTQIKIDHAFGDTLPKTISTTDEQRTQASAEMWKPAARPANQADADHIWKEGEQLTEKHEYEEALQRFIWYWNHAQEYGQASVRDSFFLSSWVELSRRYPKARQALVEIRDRDAREFLEGRGYFDLFMDVASINRELQQEDATYNLFKAILDKDPALARQCFFRARLLLLQHHDYASYLRSVGDAQPWFKHLTQQWNLARANEPFVNDTCELIEALIGAGRKPEAEAIRDQAVKLLDDPRLKSAIQEAEKKIRER